MVESKAIQSIVNQVAIQGATAVVMALRAVDEGSRLGADTASLREAHRQRHGRPALEQSLHTCDASGKYVLLLNFEIEGTNMPQMKS